jgi:hypothetical protein
MRLFILSDKSVPEAPLTANRGRRISYPRRYRR